MYPPEVTEPCRQDLTDAGVSELRTPSDVDQAIGETGTALVVINSVCGCAAGNARPAVKLAIQHSKTPDRITTVFAGVDTDATNQARTYLPGVPPSSPSIVLFKDGKLVFFLERHQIEDRGPQEIAWDIVRAFDEHC
ncbi:MAG: BrxA/BrxB family bacilliredoxin [Candidatus Krumholzibacteria bacterium]|jgi:putative YphP/YqiW family bacilliredoxin|nr:BrxA/BrxB family bacilliredoxin [Candidatus Krumholzibacteria bacterium]MCK5406099.1 BrxA/BrxB family bacilliredoxin [Candidatus Krumholzibacteria bacterium]